MVDSDDIEGFLRECEPPEATIRQVAMACDAPRDQVTNAVNQMAEWGVVRVDGDTVALVDPTAPDDASDMPCPLGCGYRPETARGAFVHLLAHTVGRHSTRRDQRTAAD
jgi:hypothetical protein